MVDVCLDVLQFYRRISYLKSVTPLPLLFLIGKTTDLELFGLNSAIFLYLLNYEFPETSIFITDNEVIFVTSSKKANILKQLQVVPKNLDSGIKVRKISIINKSEHPDFSSFFSFYSECALVDLNNIKGKFCDQVLDCFQKKIDVVSLVLDFFVNKRDDDIENSRLSSFSSSFVSKKVVNILKGSFGFNLTLDHVLQKVQSCIDRKIRDDISEANLDFIYPPMISSSYVGQSFSLSSFSHLNYRIGLRYFGYCSEIGRTILVNASEHEIRTYASLFKLREEILELFKKNIYSFDQSRIERQINDLNYPFELSFPCFYSIGIIQKESQNINKKNIDKVVLCLEIIAKLDNMVYTLIDTVLIKKGKVTFLTDKNDIEDFIVSVDQGISVKTEERQKGKIKEVERNILRNEHQKELMDALIEEMTQYYSKQENNSRINIDGKDNNKKRNNNTNEIGDEVGDSNNKRLYPYSKENIVPRHKNLFIDRKKLCILIPFNNYILPLSIAIVKNASKTDDGVLRINLNLAGNLDLIKSISYKSNIEDVNEAYMKIQEMKKEYLLNKEKGLPDDCINKDSEEEEGINKEELIVSSGRKIVLPDVMIRTDVKGRKSKSSNLELHSNGFRFINEAVNVELLFSNIKHMFFQEGDIENRTILHFNLYKPMFLPKKTMNVQFFKESGTNSVQDTSKSRNNEYMESILEKEEENKRKESNREFGLFVNKIEEVSVLRAEIPSKSGSFYGVPHKGVVLIQPTIDCLVNLTESPFFVLPLKSVEVVCFERMVYGIKTCDMVFIFKDKKKPVSSVLSIESINVSKIKDYLDSKGIVFMETKVNIQWNVLLKDIMLDPISFYENGAWNELQPNKGEEEEEESSEESTEEEISSSTDESINTDDTVRDESESNCSSESTETPEESAEEEDDDEEEEESESSNNKKRFRKRR